MPIILIAMKLSILFILIITTCGYSQLPYIDTSWVASGPEGGTVYSRSASLLQNGQLVMTGNVMSDSDDTDILTLKLKNNGDTLWTATYEGSAGENDYGIQLATTSSGDIVIIGAVQTTSGGYDYAIIRYDGATGSKIWEYMWDGAGNGMDIPASLIIDGSDNIYVTGGSQSPALSGGMSDYGVVKLSSGGSLTWASYYDNANLHDAATSISFQGSKIAVTGASADSTGAWDIATVRYNAVTGSEETVYRTNIDSVTITEAYSMVNDDENSLYITGYSESAGDQEIQTIKLDSLLDLVWIENYDTDHNDIGRDIALDDSGNVYVTGYSDLGENKWKAVTIKYDMDGNEVWSRKFGRIETAKGAKSYEIECSDSGHVYITGSKIINDSISYYFFNQYSQSGELLLSHQYESFGISDSAFNIHVDADTIYVIGLSNAASNATMSAIKYTLLQDVDASYYYAGGNPYWWSQQPGLYAFVLSDSSELTGLIDTTIISEVEFNASCGNHFVYFNDSASRTEVDSIISIIESNPLFLKEYMVATLTEHNCKPHTKRLWAGLTNNIQVVFSDTFVHPDTVLSFADKHDLTLVFSPPSNIPQGVYTFQVDLRNTNPTNSMDHAAHIWEEELDSASLVTCSPGMRFIRTFEADDPYYTGGDMWYAKNTGVGSCNDGGAYTSDADIDLDKAWNIDNHFGYGVSWSGNGVRVGVIDFDGFEYSHPDMVGVFDNGILLPEESAITTDIALNLTGGHGMNVAGIIGANANNGIGGAGVAHNCEIMPILIDELGAASIEYVIQGVQILTDDDHYIDVMNISWGGPLGLYPEEDNEMLIAIQNAVSLGRGGLGIPVICSAGNSVSGTGGVGEETLIMPACFPNTLSVGATNPQDKRKTKTDDYDWFSAWSSCFYPGLDVMAPGICIITTDIHFASGGYTYGGSYAGDYHPQFHGTSAAAPMASGVAALLLEKNEELNAYEVYNYIKWGAEEVGGYDYGGGISIEMGHGRINAFNSLGSVTPSGIDQSGVSGTFDFYFNNPANEHLYLIVPNVELYKVTILNLQGEVCYQAEGDTREVTINTDHFTKGMYIIQVANYSNNTFASKKLIIN